MFKTQCDQCFKEFTSDVSEVAARRSLTGHAARTGHSTKVLVQNQVDRDHAEKEASMADEAMEDEAAAEKQAKAEAAKAAKAEKAAEVAARKAEREAKAAAVAAEKAEKAAAREAAAEARKAPRTEPCECGCGGIPAGRKSRFLPGHDAKKASAEKAAAAA